MNISPRTALRPVARQALSVIERFVGFQTDPTGYLPNRYKMFSGKFQKYLLDAILNALPENGTFADVGANVGYFSRQCASRFPQAKIYAFEPNPRIYPLLQKNLKRFTNCELFQVGLGASDAVSEFFHGEESTVGSFVPGYTKQHGSYYKRPIETSSASVRTGDSILSHLGVVDVMKLDVEGYEVEVLMGMQKLFAEHAIKTLFFEFAPFAQRAANRRPEEIIQILAKAGYEIRQMEAEREDAFVTTENVDALISELGENGATDLRATPSLSIKSL